MPLPRDTVAWAYRILLDREPENDDVLLPKMRAYSTTRELRHDMVTSDEYQEKNRDFAHTNDRTLVIKELAFIRRSVSPGQHVIDCGAHIGFFAIHMAALVGPGGSVAAFEPFPANAECLDRSVRENGFESRVRVQRAAVGAASGTIPLVFARNTINSGGAFLLREGSELPHGHLAAEVAVVALDRVSLARPVGFIKTDIEGAEPLAMRGAERILQEDRPTILSELHPLQLDRVAGTSPAGFIAEMRQRRYACHLLGAGVPGPEIDDAPTNGVTSVVFLPM